MTLRIILTALAFIAPAAFLGLVHWAGPLASLAAMIGILIFGLCMTCALCVWFNTEGWRK
jgi:hypothetical protein